MRIKKINHTYFAVIIFAVALLLLSIPILRVSQGNPAIPGKEHYTYLNTPSTIIDYLLNYIPHIILSISLPLLMAIASLFIFAKLLLRRVKKEQHLYYSLIILLLTPVFIGLHIGLHKYQFIFFFGLLFALLYDMKTKWYYLPLTFLYFLDPLLGLITLLGTIVIESSNDRGKNALALAFYLIGILLLSNVLPIPPLSVAGIGFSLSRLFSFFNAPYGYSLFILILGLGGLFLEKKKYVAVAILLISLFYEPLQLFGIVILSYYAAKSFFTLQERNWSLPFIGTLTLVLFVSILLFSSSTFIKETIQDNPHKELVDALIYLDDYGVQAKVLSGEEYLGFITFMSGEEAVAIPQYFKSQQYRYIDSEFKKNDIGYILIDESMKQGKIWQYDEEGLLFLLKYNDNFKKIYEENGVEIYYFAPWRE